jgi:hypothetical protein
MKLLGDLVADVAQFFGVAPCDRCKRRRKKLNAADARVRAKLGGKKRKPPCADCTKVKRI